MATADELVREAQYAFRSISHGSTDERKYRARAEKYARRVIRKYPTSIEASQARNILDQLNVRTDVRSPLGVSPQAGATADFGREHSSDSSRISDVEDWKSLFRRFAELPRNKKKILGVIAAVTIFIPGGIFAVFGLVIFYAMQPALLKEHLNLLLKKLGSE